MEKYLYFIRVLTLKEKRNLIIDDVFDRKISIKFKYLNGTHSKMNLYDRPYLALFWRNKETAIKRLESHKNTIINRKLQCDVLQISEDEFLKLIPTGRAEIKNIYEASCYETNKSIKNKILLKRKNDKSGTKK
jgi:hypothetical protein